MPGEDRGRARCCSTTLSPHRGRRAEAIPTSHRRAQTDRQTCACQDSRHLPIPSHMRRRWETLGGACLFLDRSARLEAGPWGQDGRARKGCPRTECDEGSHPRLLCTWGLTSGGPAPSLLNFPSPRPYLLVSGLGTLPPPHTFLQASCGTPGVDISLPPSHDTEMAALQAPPTRAPSLRIT